MTTLEGYFTVGQLAKQETEPLWKIREVVDRLGVTLPRVSGNRLIPAALLPRVRAELKRRRQRKEAAASRA
jgi:hypothetical protein